MPNDLIRFNDDDRGMVVLSGDPDDVSAGVQLLKSLDVNWLSAVSTALIPIRNAEPGELAADLDPVLSLKHSSAKFDPPDRIFGFTKSQMNGALGRT